MSSENLLVLLVKFPSNSPSTADYEIACRWNLLASFASFDNSRHIRRLNSKWKPPDWGYTTLNFDGAARHDLAVGGEIIGTSIGELVATYAGNLNYYSSN